MTNGYIIVDTSNIVKFRFWTGAVWADSKSDAVKYNSYNGASDVRHGLHGKDNATSMYCVPIKIVW